jgi:hypothetical protein
MVVMVVLGGIRALMPLTRSPYLMVVVVVVVGHSGRPVLQG